MHRTHKIFAIGLATAALVGALATAGAATASTVAGWAWNGPTVTPGGKAWNTAHVQAGGWIYGTSTPGGKAWNGTRTSNVTALEYG
jgi:hypothetical protein